MSTTDFAEQRDDLLRSIEREREVVRVAVHELTGAAQSKLSIGERIEKYPLSWTIGGFLLGVWLGRRHGAVTRSATPRRG